MSAGESTSDITEGTYRALCKHGYADVTMEDIAAETDVSKSALHYHYDSKHDLLVSFFDDLLEGFTERLDAVDGESAYEGLLNLIDAVLFPPDDDAPDLGFQTAVLEMKAQAPTTRRSASTCRPTTGRSVTTSRRSSPPASRAASSAPTSTSRRRRTSS